MVQIYGNNESANEMLRILIDGGLLIDGCAWLSIETPLHKAIALKKFHLACTLIQHGADCNVECPHDITILHKACQIGEEINNFCTLYNN